LDVLAGCLRERDRDVANSGVHRERKFDNRWVQNQIYSSPANATKGFREREGLAIDGFR
jgi:hypothetical protein